MNVNYRGTILGPPLPTCSLFIVEPDQSEIKLVPCGLSGELVIGGPQVSLGYLNRPDQTKVSFVQHTQLGRLYRTGDRARLVWDDQGEMMVEISGRINSEQVKIDGRRVELGEVDSVLNSVEGVRLAVTVLCQSRLVAMVSPRPGYEESKLLQACREKVHNDLAPFLRPHRIVYATSIPQNSAGKADRKAVGTLLAKESNSLTEEEGEVADTPSNLSQEQLKLESKLKSSLEQVLGNISRRISSTTPLLDVGLSSLDAMLFLQLTRKLESDKLRPLTLSDLVQEDCSIRRLAVKMLHSPPSSSSSTALSAYLDEKDLEDCVRLLGRPVEKAMRVTATQAGTLSSFYRSSASSGPKTYIHHSIYTLPSDIDVEKLADAFRTVLSRHEAFRIVFIPRDDEGSPFAQCVLPIGEKYPEHKLALVDLTESQVTEDEVSNTLSRHEDSMTMTTPSIRGSLVTKGKASIFVMSIMHAVFDGGSLQILLSDLEREYRSEICLHRTEMAFAVQEYLSATSSNSGIATAKFWRDELVDFTPEPFPCLSGEKGSDLKGSLTAERICDSLTLKQLQDKASSSHISVLSMVQLAWSLLLLSFSEAEAVDVVFGSVVSNRLDSNAQNCIAPTFTTIPARFRLDDTVVTLRDALQRLTKRAAASLPHTQPALGSIKTSEGKLPYDTLVALQLFDENQEASRLWNHAEYPAMHNDFAVMVEVWPTSSNGPMRLKVSRGDVLHSSLLLSAPPPSSLDYVR